MTEIRIEKVTNGYIVRCFGGEDHNSYDDTFVYPDIMQTLCFVSMQMNENRFAQHLDQLIDDLTKK